MSENTEDGKTPRRELQLIGLWYLLGVMLLLVVGALSLIPLPDVGVGDKLSHLVTYVFLGGWFGLLAANRRILCWTVAGLMAFGILLELLQGMTTYRYAEWGDVLANGSGILIGVAAYFTPLTRVLGYVDRKLNLILSR